ncbi:MAG: SiaC family regulatory phosphoprotein [Bacteroidales bacterium]|nr:SiaC family regulatory phosphoprotein [Bacteroidales bacterium]
MQNFCIEGSKNSPEVSINSLEGIIEIKGVSTFQDPIDFYLDLAKWIYAFNIKKINTRTVNIKLDKVNNGSARWMFLIIKQLEKIDQQTNSIRINWYYSKNNSQIFSIGQKYCSTVNLPFTLIAA